MKIGMTTSTSSVAAALRRIAETGVIVTMITRNPNQMAGNTRFMKNIESDIFCAICGPGELSFLNLQ